MTLRIYLLLSIIGIFYLMLFSCHLQSQETGVSKAKRNRLEEDANMKLKTPQRYYFEMNERDFKIFLSQFNKINIGDSMSQVKDILGPPSNEMTVSRKEPDSPVFIVLDYYVKRWEKDFVNTNYDKVVSLYFSEQRLVKIRSNVEGINSR